MWSPSCSACKALGWSPKEDDCVEQRALLRQQADAAVGEAGDEQAVRRRRACRRCPVVAMAANEVPSKERMAPPLTTNSRPSSGRSDLRDGRAEDCRMSAGGLKKAVPLPPLPMPGERGDRAVGVGHAEVRDAVAVEVADVDGDRLAAAGVEPRAGRAVPDAVRGSIVADEDRDVVGAVVDDGEVQDAVAVEVGDGDGDRLGADGVGGRRAEAAARRGRGRRGLVAEAVGDDEVGRRLAVGSGGRPGDGAGGQQRAGGAADVWGGRSRRTGRGGVAEVDLDLVVLRVGDDGEGPAVGGLADGERPAGRGRCGRC